MKKAFIIIGITIFSLALVIAVITISHFVSVYEESVFIIPEGFTGIAIIAYEQPDGMDDVEEDGKTIYRFNKNGVLKLKRKNNASIGNQFFYYENAQGIRTYLEYCFPPCEKMNKNPDMVHVGGFNNGSFTNAGEELKLSTFYVGNSLDADSLYNVYQKSNPLEIVKSN